MDTLEQTQDDLAQLTVKVRSLEAHITQLKSRVDDLEEKLITWEETRNV